MTLRKSKDVWLRFLIYKLERFPILFKKESNDSAGIPTIKSGKTTKGLQKTKSLSELKGNFVEEVKEDCMENRRLFSNESHQSSLRTRKRVLRNFSFASSVFFLIFFVLFTNVGCKPSAKDQIQKILSDRQIPVEEKIRQTSFLLLGDRLKEIEISPSIAPDGNTTDRVRVTLAVGGNTALTFLGQKEYKERMKLEVALLSFRVLQTLKNLPIESFRVSIVKPYYVKNSPTDSIEEFEVFRATMEKNSLIRIKGFETVDSFAADSYDSPEPAVLDVMVQIVQSWKVELDELNRVELN